jgi:quercetin dioxygenase-like cupin family protein
MKRTRILVIAGLATVCGAGAAFAAHVSEVDPATVPTGTLAAHNTVDGIRISSIARAVDDGKADVFVTHARFAPGQDTGWHTHPGPVFVQVVKGSLTYQDARHDCMPRTYQAGQGFFDRGHGHVHRAVAGASGAEFYPVFVLPPGSPAHIIPTTAPEECTTGGVGAEDSDDHDDSDDAHEERDEAEDDQLAH